MHPTSVIFRRALAGLVCFLALFVPLMLQVLSMLPIFLVLLVLFGLFALFVLRLDVFAAAGIELKQARGGAD